MPPVVSVLNGATCLKSPSVILDDRLEGPGATRGGGGIAGGCI